MTDRTRTISVQVSEETHARFRMLRAATGLLSHEVVAMAIERLTPAMTELTPDVLADVQRLVPELVEIEPPVVDPLPQPTEELELGISLNGQATNPFSW